MNRIIFIVAFFVLAFNLYADPTVRYTESMGWINKSEKDVVSAGGIKTGERGALAVYEFYTANGKNKLVLTGNKVIALVFENDNRQNPIAGKTLYKNENEFTNDAERLIALARSMGGYLHHDRSDNVINHIHYRVDSANAFDVNMNVFSHLTNKAENNYGYYSIMITAAGDTSAMPVLMPPPSGAPPGDGSPRGAPPGGVPPSGGPPPGAHPPGTPPPGAR